MSRDIEFKFEDIIEELKKLKEETVELRRSKSQSEHILAAILNKYGKIELNFEDIFKTDIDKVKILNDESDSRKTMTFIYQGED
ncbi:hypothetical protein [Niallia taxi]|uniref:hypothetical protein n=1 Tax=Niallia taxi TaxID=2499688 RepID=UPI00300A6B9C